MNSFRHGVQHADHLRRAMVDEGLLAFLPLGDDFPEPHVDTAGMGTTLGVDTALSTPPAVDVSLWRVMALLLWPLGAVAAVAVLAYFGRGAA